MAPTVPTLYLGPAWITVSVQQIRVHLSPPVRLQVPQGQRHLAAEFAV